MDKVGRFEPPPSSLLHPYHHNGGISDEDCGAQATALPSSCTGQGSHSRSPASQLSRAQIMQVALVMLLYGILYTVFSGNLTVASLAASDLTTQSRATLPLVALFVGALLVVGPASNIMKVHGRRVGFFIGGMAGNIDVGEGASIMGTSHRPTKNVRLAYNVGIVRQLATTAPGTLRNL